MNKLWNSIVYHNVSYKIYKIGKLTIQRYDNTVKEKIAEQKHVQLERNTQYYNYNNN